MKADEFANATLRFCASQGADRETLDFIRDVLVKKGQSPSKRKRYTRFKLSEDAYERLNRVANANGLAVAAYIRQAVLQRVRKDDSEGGDK